MLEELRTNKHLRYAVISGALFVFIASAALAGRVVGNFGYFGVVALDGIMGAFMTPDYPYLAWLGTGALIGASGAFWTIAPSYGLKKMRWLVFIPLLLLMAYSISRAAGG